MTLAATDLLDSAVGRQLCLAYLDSLATATSGSGEHQAEGAVRFQKALQTAAMVIDLSAGSSTVFGWTPDGALLNSQQFLSDLTAQANKEGLVGENRGKVLGLAMSQVHLPEITDLQLMQALADACAKMHFWGQHPDGEEQLCQLPEVRLAMLRIAEHICESPATAWWYEPWSPTEQWLVKPAARGGKHGSVQAPKTLQEHESLTILIENAFQQAEDEHRSAQSRRGNPEGEFVGVWWSFPPYALEKTTSMIPGIGPVGVYCEEDSQGASEKDAWSVSTAVSRVYEIETADDWARLCAWYPVDVTSTRLDMWSHNTGRHGKWVIPDWIKVAHDFDAVHLTAAAYIALAGKAIPVTDLGERGEWASCIAGWTPDWTFYFVPVWITGSKHSWQVDDSVDGPVLWSLRARVGTDS